MGKLLHNTTVFLICNISFQFKICANMPLICALRHAHMHLLSPHICLHGYFKAKSTYGPIIWPLKVFGLIFNSAGGQVCQPLDCLNHIIPQLCILMSVHQAKVVCVCVCYMCVLCVCFSTYYIVLKSAIYQQSEDYVGQ